AIAWLFVGNALLYVGYLAVSGEWRRRFFWPPRDLRPAWRQAAYYLRLRKEPPSVHFYNRLQRLPYTPAIPPPPVEVLSGLAIWKPVQLALLARLFGGYDGARAVHFAALVLLAGFVAGHVVMAVLHPRSLGEMITGGKPNAKADA